MKKKSKKTRKISVISFPDNFVKFIPFYVSFNSLVYCKIIKGIKMITGYNRTLIFQRKIIFFQPTNFLNYKTAAFYEAVYKNTSQKVGEFYL